VATVLPLAEGRGDFAGFDREAEQTQVDLLRDVQGLFCSDISGQPFHGSQDWRAACAVYDHYVVA
jgi:hypothetical protein